MNNISRSGFYVSKPKNQINFIAWIGTIATITGALLVASGVFYYGYILFLVGAICWFSVAAKRHDNALASLNAFYAIINIYGFLNLGL